MRVIIEEEQFEYISDYPKNWNKVEGISYKFPVILGTYKCLVKRFEHNSVESVPGWTLMLSLNGKRKPFLPMIYDIVPTREGGEDIHYLFQEYLQGETLDIVIGKKATVNLTTLTNHLFSALRFIHDSKHWVCDISEKNIFHDVDENRFLISELNNCCSMDSLPPTAISSGKAYRTLVFNFYKEIIGSINHTELPGAILNYLEVIFLILELKICIEHRLVEYRSSNLLAMLPAILNKVDPIFRQVFEKAYEDGQRFKTLRWAGEIKEYIISDIIDKDISKIVVNTKPVTKTIIRPPVAASPQTPQTKDQDDNRHDTKPSTEKQSERQNSATFNTMPSVPKLDTNKPSPEPQKHVKNNHEPTKQEPSITCKMADTAVPETPRVKDAKETTIDKQPGNGPTPIVEKSQPNAKPEFASRPFKLVGNQDSKKTYEVFISYSHHDKRFIAPLVKLVKALRKDLVFQDSSELNPGDLWEEKLLAALHSAEIVIVFWCSHAAQSAYVKKEYELGIEKGKIIIPLLLDNAQLTPGLSRSQAIDLRSTHVHDAKSYFIKLAWNEFKKYIVRSIPAIAGTIVINDIVGPKEIAKTIMEALNRLLPKIGEDYTSLSE